MKTEDEIFKDFCRVHLIPEDEAKAHRKEIENLLAFAFFRLGFRLDEFGKAFVEAFKGLVTK